MDVGTVSQIVTVALAVLAIIWHQQLITDKLRERLDKVEQRIARIELPGNRHAYHRSVGGTRYGLEARATRVFRT